MLLLAHFQTPTNVSGCLAAPWVPPSAAAGKRVKGLHMDHFLIHRLCCQRLTRGPKPRWGTPEGCQMAGGIGGGLEKGQGT